MKVAKLESTVEEKDLIIENLKNDLNLRSKENGDLHQSNRIIKKTNEQLEKTIKEL